jgi:hypothetical protein
MSMKRGQAFVNRPALQARPDAESGVAFPRSEVGPLLVRPQAIMRA